jgi:hypothetical protein
MNFGRFARLLALGAALGMVPAASATDVPGGGKAKVDCYVGFDVSGTSNPSTFAIKQKKKAEQRSCGGSCEFSVAACINVPASPKCTAQPVTSLTVDSPVVAPVTGGSDRLCGDPVTITVPEGKKKTVIRMSGVGADGKTDKDVLQLQCKKNKQNTGCGPPVGCPANEAGGPDQLVVTVKADGNDLDNGWTGVSHNFPVPSDSKLTFCLSGCDAAGNSPMCTATGATGAGSVNTATFGPPLPLVAGGVPVCVINRFATSSITSQGNFVTGEVNGSVDLLSDVFVTDITRVCPRCENGTCDSGLNSGKQCSVDGTVLVFNSIAPNKNFKLSKQCPPFGSPVSTLTITLPVTTGQVGTPGTGGSKPCREREAQGVPAKDNDCTGGCNCGPGACAPGSPVCTQMVPSPVDPNTMICKDQKGGLTQCCCSNNPGLSCQPTEQGNVGIIRVGRPVPPTQDASDPNKWVADGAVLAATFCEAATGNANIDTVSGLPGPGALLLNTHMEFTRQPPADTTP